VVLSQRDLD